MSKFFVCQRIKKVRGEVCIGIEATVVGLDHPDPFYNMSIVLDRPAEFIYEGVLYYVPSGIAIGAKRCDWEPAIGPDGLTIEQDKRIEEIA